MCPGPKIYGQPQKDRPWVIPPNRGPIWWGKHKLHKTHKAAWFRGVLYCNDCGHFSLRGQSLRGLGERCRVDPAGRYCQMTMNLIKHGTPRAGFKDWPTYNNIPGKEEPEVAKYAYPDPDWEKEPPPRTYNSKSSTGAKIANKIRDLRLRRSLTGTTVNPRLVKKTKPKDLEQREQVDFEAEIRKYKEDIEEDIQQYKSQPYKEPEWIRAELNSDRNNGASSSSSSWTTHISDSQAVEMSDYLLTEHQAQIYMSEEDDIEEEPENGPSWEHIWFHGQESDAFPADLRPYGPEAYGAYWEQWLAEIIRPPPPGYHYQQK